MASQLREQQDSAHEKKASIREFDGGLKEKQETKNKVFELSSLFFSCNAFFHLRKWPTVCQCKQN